MVSRVVQKDWKRTQLRLPFSHYEAVLAYADSNNLSINSAILELIDKALLNNSSQSQVLNEAFSQSVALKVVAMLGVLDEKKTST
jgi:hypothetical protein